MDAKRDEDRGGDEHRDEGSVALLVDVEAEARRERDDELKQAERVGITLGETAMDATSSPREEKRDEDEESYGEREATDLAGPPPPPLMRVYDRSLPDSFDEQKQHQHQHLPISLPPRNSSEEDVDCSGKRITARRDEWASTRRSGKRSQLGPRAEPKSGSIGSTHAQDEAQEKDRLLHELHQAQEEDDSRSNYIKRPEELISADVLGSQPNADAMRDENVAVVNQRLLQGASMESCDAPSINLSTAHTADKDVVPPRPLANHSIAQAEELTATESSSLAVAMPAVILPRVQDESSKLLGPRTTDSSTRPSYSEEEDEEEEWVPCMSDSGHPYFYNRTTHECHWQRPQTPKLRQEALCAVLTADGAKRLEYLLRNGLDPNVETNDGVTLLQMAAQSGNDRAVEVLVGYGAAVDTATGSATTSPLLLACQHGHSRIVKTLLECGAAPGRADEHGNSVLHTAVYSRSDDVLRVVLGATGDGLVNQKNAEGETALHIAAKLDDAAAVGALLAHGADAQLEDALGQAPLVVGILENSVTCVQLLQNAHLSSKMKSGAREGHTSLPQAAHPDASTEDSENDVDKLLASIVPAPESCDREVLEALRTFADETQRAISTLEDELQEKKRNEKNYHSQLQSLSSSLQSANDELKKEKQLRLQLEADAVAKASEHEALRSSLMGAMTRCSLLESVARDAYAKLKTERAERVRSDDEMSQRLQKSLDDNASLLQSLYALHAAPIATESETRLFVDPTRAKRRTSGSTRRAATPSRYVTYPPPVSVLPDSNEPPRPVFHHGYGEQQDQQESQMPRHVTFAEPRSHNKREEVRSGSVAANYSGDVGTDALEAGRTPPSRVGAVWNRFYENLGQAGSTSNSAAQFRPRTSTTLFDTVRRRDLEHLQALLLSGSSPNQRDASEKGTPLHLACELGDLDAVVLLCDFAADVEARDEEDNTPLLTACAQGNYECAKFLLQSAASLDAMSASGETALHLAAWDGSAECVAILIEYGVDTSVANAFGLTALGNLKTRSPLRHKLDDMASDHPIRRTIRLLEEHEEKQRVCQSERVEKRNRAREADVAPLASPPASQPARSSTWKEWFFGVAKAPTESTSATHSDDASSDGGEDDGELSPYSDAELDASALQSVAYPTLKPPPEVAEALSQAGRRSSQTTTLTG